MPQFSFDRRFADAVERGEKRQTVRATRRHRPRVGQTAHLFVGMRTRACRSLGTHTITAVEDVRIGEARTVWLRTAPDRLYVPLLDAAADRFAQADGFAGAAELVAWIETRHGLPFEGVVTYW